MQGVGNVQNSGVITFLIGGDVGYSPDNPETCLTLSAKDAKDLLVWLAYTADDFGCLELQDLRARCIRRLWPEPRNFDPEVPQRLAVGPNGSRYVISGRAPGYLRARTQELLQLVERARQLTASTGFDHAHILYH